MAENNKKSIISISYVPLKTFISFIDKLHSTAIPPIIDSSLLDTMSGSMKGQLLSSLRFLNLVDSNNTVNEPLKDLVKHYKTDSWCASLEAVIFDAYQNIIDNVDLDTGTAQQLYDAFRKAGNVDGQMLDKAVRFFLSSLDACEYKYSPFFKAKKIRKVGPRKARKIKKKNQTDYDDLDDDLEEEEENSGAKRVKINIGIPGKKSVSVRLPVDMDEDDWEMVKTMLEAYVRRLTKAGEGGS